MSDDRTPASGGLGSTGDTRAIVRSIIGTGIGLATLLLMLIGLMVQQNASVNARIDDVNTRIDDVNTRIDDVNTSVNARIDDLRGEMSRRIDDVQEDIRELRTLVIDALERTGSAD